MYSFKKIIICILLLLFLIFIVFSATGCHTNDTDITKPTQKNKKAISEQQQTSQKNTATKDEMEREIQSENARHEYELSKIKSEYNLNSIKYKNTISSYECLVTHTESELSSEIRSINQQIAELEKKIKSSSSSLEPGSSLQTARNMNYQLQIQNLSTKLDALKREKSYYSAISKAKRSLAQCEEEKADKIEQENTIHQENIEKIKNKYN